MKAKRTGRGYRLILNVIVFAAMGAAALAFAAGLHFQAGSGPVAAAVAGIALFFLMASSHAAFVQLQSQGALAARMTALERALGGFSGDVADIGKARETMAQLDELGQRFRSFKRVADQIDKVGSFVDGAAQINRLTAEIERVDTRLEALRSHVAIETADKFEKLAAEFKILETLVKQLAERLAVDAQSRERTLVPAQPADGMQAAPSDGPAADDGGDEAGDQLAGLSAGEIDSLLVEEVRRSIEAGKVELYLQPIVTLPPRRVRYYEALTRLKNEDGRIMLPKDYLRAAEAAGVMPVIDNVMLFRSVQVLRRLETRSSARGVFCNISVHSLLDPEFFSEFIAFMEQNRQLSERLYFEFGQSVIDTCGPVERESLAALAELGFRFSLDQVHNLDIDYQALQAKGFRAVKIDADLFLNRMAESGAPIHAADMRSYLERFGLQLIVEKIEDESSLAQVLYHNARLGQGYLFSEPRPVRPEVFAGADKAAAA